MRIHSIEDARSEISRVLRELIAVKRARLGGSTTAAVMEISDETEIAAAYLWRAKKNCNGSSFAPHLHYWLRLEDALTREHDRVQERIAKKRRLLGEIRNARNCAGPSEIAQGLCGVGVG